MASPRLYDHRAVVRTNGGPASARRSNARCSGQTCRCARFSRAARVGDDGVARWCTGRCRHDSVVAPPRQWHTPQAYIAHAHGVGNGTSTCPPWQRPLRQLLGLGSAIMQPPPGRPGNARSCLVQRHSAPILGQRLQANAEPTPLRADAVVLAKQTPQRIEPLCNTPKLMVVSMVFETSSS